MGLLPCPGGDTSVAHISLLLTEFYFKVAANSAHCHCFQSPWYPLGDFVGLLQIVPQTVPVKDQDQRQVSE